MKRLLTMALAAALLAPPASGEGKWLQTPYQPPKVLFEFYLDNPQKIGSALFWVRSLLNTLSEAPYAYPPEDMNIVIVLHGTEIVTTAKKNEASYQEVVDRMRYYADLGVQFKVCGQAAEEYGYSAKDFQAFIDVVPNAIPELAHWQQQGYALIIPQIFEKKLDIDKIR
jgi:intracellular sulfur oxidation DsrE/DsrF family protein